MRPNAPIASKALRYNGFLVSEQEISLRFGAKDEGNSRRFRIFCERIFYNS